MATNLFTAQVNYGRKHPDFQESNCRLRKFCGPLLYRLLSKWGKKFIYAFGTILFLLHRFSENSELLNGYALGSSGLNVIKIGQETYI